MQDKCVNQRPLDISPSSKTAKYINKTTDKKKCNNATAIGG